LSSDLRQQLQRTLGNSYTLDRELAGGAMSRVFAATETALGRRVVVKVRSSELAAGVSADRFSREIRFAASLQQANIVPVLAAGETDGMPYYTMPFVEGLSLRERLSREGPLPIPDTIGVLRDVARALAYAHEHGVVHRDIKPENILLSGDAAVVTDFGIAKAISIARTIEGRALDQGSTLTSAGVVVGTPAYMAPEQASGDPDMDHRADLYAFGCVAYELLAGRPPFHGRSAHELFAAHIAEPPAPILEHRPDCPPGLAALVMQCLDKKPVLRPASAREILARLEVVTTPASSAPGTGGRRRRIAAGVGIASVAVLVAGYFIAQTRGGVSQAADDVKSLAVLPLNNVGGDSTQEYLADGITDELVTALGKVEGMRIASRSLARRYRGQRDIDAREVGQAVNVGYVLQGTVRRVGDKLRVAANLTSAADGVEIWSDSYDRETADVIAMQGDITRAITSALRLRLVAGAASTQGTSNPEAYDLYLRGRFLLERRGAGVTQAVDNFSRAIAADSNFARAHAGLSFALQLLPYFGGVPPRQIKEPTLKAARHALARDENLAEAYIALALAAQHEYDWQAAGRYFERAIAVQPKEQAAHLQYARFLLYINRIDEALTEFQLAKALDPYAALPSSWIGTTLWLLNRPNEAIAEFQRALQIDSVNGPAIQGLSKAYAEVGRFEEAAKLVEKLKGSYLPYQGEVAYVHGLIGDRAGALRIARMLERERPIPWFGHTMIAYAYLSLPDTTAALTALERGIDAGEIWPSYWPLSTRSYDPVRRTERFAALMRRVGLADYGFTTPSGGRPQ
jgi:serine/threonine-protein kinase